MSESLLDLDVLLDSWCRQLRGERKSVETLRAYRGAVETFLKFCADTARAPELTKANVLAWIDTQHDAKTATVRLRLAGIKQFAKWLAAEEGFDADPIAAIKPPKLKQDDVPDLSVNELQRMLKVCDGPSFRDKRDKAILMMLADTGARASELLALNITDVDLDECMAHIHGKGGKSRRARFSHGTAAALDRYVRARRSRVTRPTSGPLWLSVRGQRLSYTGLRTTLQERASDAGVVAFHAHRLRHTMSVRWLRSGGSETGLRAHAGWSSNTMITRYVKAASEQLAAEEFDRLNLGLTEL